MVEEENIDATTNGTEEPEDDDKIVKKSNRHDGGVADLERVTDYAEEKELSSADITNVYTPNLNRFIMTKYIYIICFIFNCSCSIVQNDIQAINIFGDKRNQETAEKLAKERELQKIVVRKEDIEIIVSIILLVFELPITYVRNVVSIVHR